VTRTADAPPFLKILGACSFGLWIGAMGVSFHYDATRPEMPRPRLGQIYELSNHGHVVYISFDDGLLFYGMMLVGMAGWITTIGIGQRIHRSRPSSPAHYQ
jgi:hypothetical protein